jgi:hypothetical protein
MVRRRSTVRFRNGAPLKGQVRSSLDSSHPTLRMGAVAVLGGIWEIVFFLPGRARPVGTARVSWEMPGSRREPEACRILASGMRLNGGIARWPYGHEMITLPEHIGEPC